MKLYSESDSDPLSSHLQCNADYSHILTEGFVLHTCKLISFFLPAIAMPFREQKITSRSANTVIMWSLIRCFYFHKVSAQDSLSACAAGLFCVLVAQQPFIQRHTAAVYWMLRVLQAVCIIFSVNCKITPSSRWCHLWWMMNAKSMVLNVYVYVFVMYAYIHGASWHVENDNASLWEREIESVSGGLGV